MPEIKKMESEFKSMKIKAQAKKQNTNALAVKESQLAEDEKKEDSKPEVLARK